VSAGQVASREEVEAFLAETKFSGYQEVPLPHGLSVPGQNRERRADQVFSMDMSGRTFLDVGTSYGVFPYEAMERGAARAVGLEPNPRSYAVAKRIAELHGGRWEIRQARAEELSPDETFDVVTFLNVLHHVTDPVEAVRRLLRVCNETMVIEFCRPDDPEYLEHLARPGQRIGHVTRWRARAKSVMIRPVLNRIPAMAVGNWAYHRTFYFSPAAFDNLFRLHLGFFEEIAFARSVTGKRRVVAHCRVARR
jgi:SAM-dependent methyltransferase